MFTRKLQQLVAYTNENPILSEVPERLNGATERWRNGFQAGYHSSLGSDGCPGLRDFFGRMCDVTETAHLGSDVNSVPFGDILPCFPKGNWDDIGFDVEAELPLERLVLRCVEVEVADGKLVVKRSRFLDRTDPSDSQILEHFRSTRRGSELCDRPSHRPLIHLVMVLWRERGRLYVSCKDKWTEPEPYNALKRLVEAVNGEVLIPEARLLGYLSPYRTAMGDAALHETLRDIKARLDSDPDLWMQPAGE
jgi:hypothetical protein